MTFRDFMESALYDPDKGFYSLREPTADFYTAPELTPLLGQILAEEVSERLDRLAARRVPEPYFLVEMGSGTGLLARQILYHLRSFRPDLLARVRYALVERSEGALLESLVALNPVLAGCGARVLGFSRLQDLPSVHGIFFSNELVDSLPCHLLRKHHGKVREVYMRGGVQELGPLSSPRLGPVATRIEELLEEGETHAVSLEAMDWIREVAGKMLSGTLLTIDYGNRTLEPVRRGLKTFFRHTLAEDPSARPGLQDLSCPADFEALIAEGERVDLKLESYASLSSYLIGRGILERLPKEYAERNRAKTLFHPEGMGEAFKVLIQYKS